MNRRRFWSGLVCAAAVSGCAVGPNYRTPETPTPAAWNGVKPAATTTQPAGPTTRPAELADWWTALNDAMLNSLIERAVASNLDLRVATARVREARAQRGVVAGDLWPQVDFSSGYNYHGSSLNTGPKPQGQQSLSRRVRNSVINSAANALLNGQTVDNQAFADRLGQILSNGISQRLQKNGGSTSRGQNLFQAGFDAGWELDVFGGLRRAVEAAEADLAAAEESRRDVLVTLLAEVALNYVQLRGAQRQLVIARENIRIQQDTVEVTQAKSAVGFISKLPVAQAQAQLASTKSQVPALEITIQQAIYQLSVLLAQPPVALLAELEREGPIPANPPDIPVGLPSDLLRRRPDVRAAERELAAATARIGEAVADLFPRFSLTGSFSSQSRDINHLLDRNSLGWSIGPQLSWPVFQGGRIIANIEVQNARQEQALAVYEKTVLTALQDVEKALVAYTKEQVRHEVLTEEVAASQRSADMSNELYANQSIDFLNVVESQRVLYSSQNQLVQSETAVITDLIALYKALGGGWPGQER